MTKPYCIGSDEWNGLSKLIEELGELLQVCGKVIGSEGSCDHWSGDLREKFIEECGDSQAALNFFIQNNFDSYEMTAINTRVFQKEAKFIEWNIETRNKDALDT